MPQLSELENYFRGPAAPEPPLSGAFQTVSKIVHLVGRRGGFAYPAPYQGDLERPPALPDLREKHYVDSEFI
jgi:hypothetical protein